MLNNPKWLDAQRWGTPRRTRPMVAVVGGALVVGVAGTGHAHDDHHGDDEV